MEKQNEIPRQIYDKILKSQQQLTNYLKYIRYKQPIPKIRTHLHFLNEVMPQKQFPTKYKKSGIQIKRYVESYVQSLKQVFGLEPGLSKKVIKRFVKYLEELPMMNILLENTFGKQKKKLALSESMIMMQANDDMIPMFQKIIQKLKNLKQQSQLIKTYVENYLKLVKEIQTLQSYLSKKIIKKLLEFLEEIPAMSFLYEVIHSFGKDQKKISLNYNNIISFSNEDMIPLFQKIINKIQSLKKQGQSKKLLQLGHRIQHLQSTISQAKNSVKENSQHHKIFKIFESDRLEKYMLMEQNINKAQKNYGQFSVNLIKNKEVFSNLNKVYYRIKNPIQS